MKRTWTVLVAAAFALSGCASIERKVFSGYAAHPLSESSSSLRADLVKGLVDGKVVPAACFEAPMLDGNKPICKSARNQAIASLSLASAELCLEHRKSIYGREAASNITFGTLGNLFAGAAAVATGESAKTLNAALSLFFNSERSLVNETVYKTMIVPAVDQKIVESMSTQATTLHTRMALGIDDFGMYEAIDGVVKMHSTCSFMDGLRLALSEGTRGSNARKILTLRQHLQVITSEVNAECRVTPATEPCKNAQARQKSVSDALKVLESSAD